VRTEGRSGSNSTSQPAPVPPPHEVEEEKREQAALLGEDLSGEKELATGCREHEPAAWSAPQPRAAGAAPSHAAGQRVTRRMSGSTALTHRQHFAPDAHASGLPGITTHFSAVQRARQSFPPGRRQLLAAGSTWDHNAVLRATSLRLRAQGALHLRTDGREHFVPPRGIRAVSTPFTSARGSGDTTVRIWNPSSSAGTDGDLDDTIPEHIEAVEWVLALASSRMSLRSV